MSTNQELSFAVTVSANSANQGGQGEGASGRWHVAVFKDQLEDIATSIKAVRKLRAEGVSFAMLCVDDDYFIIARPTPTGVKLLISDASAAEDDDLAASVLDEMNAEYPDPEDGPIAEGDFDIFEDLGISEQVLGVIADDEDAWASEQLLAIAEELGFAEQLADAADLDY